MSKVKRIFVEKKQGFDVAAQEMFNDLSNNLGVSGLERVRILIRYDIEGISDSEYDAARNTIFAEPPIDNVYDETLPFSGEHIFATEFLPGQYDQRADSAAQCIQIITHGNRPSVATAKVIILEGNISNQEFEKIKSYNINPVDSREASLDKPQTLTMDIEVPSDVQVMSRFIDFTTDELENLRKTLGLAMRLDDLIFCQDYFKNTEKRNPTITEIRMLDTYWSDHCRHTTFLTKFNSVQFDNGKFNTPVKETYETYQNARKFVYENKERNDCLMDIALIGMKELRKKKLLEDLDVSEEINACSIVVPVTIDGKEEEWLVMFKNETHNHPTEIEPFGGAATCLGGAIRDPLSGRAYVYQAMRVTGAADPRKGVEETLAGKLPQRKITTLAAQGYSSYGNQIGLATGLVTEIYDEGYVAKRMEIGAVVGAAPKRNVVRMQPSPDDIIVLTGGRTGRDGCGGATGSSKEHTEESISTCSAEVQKGNPPTERKLQKLFRNPNVSKLIKRCNDFGAGGVSVAIGELADGLVIDLDSVPRKYEGLDGTELAISESQERMAVVIDPNDLETFVKYASEQNLETAVVAKVTNDNRLKMIWRGKTIVDISRDFINTNGVQQETDIKVAAPSETPAFKTNIDNTESIETEWLRTLQDLNVCSQKGLVERFDSTIGAGSVFLPFGGKYQTTPTESMVAKIPLLKGETNCATAMSFGYNPSVAKWSPFHGALYAIVESVAKITAAGGDYRKIRLTLQEYFEKIGSDSYKWGKPFSALLGAYLAQKEFEIPAIGGKDSMSGTFKNKNVPPTLVSFALAPVEADKVISPEFKETGSEVVLVKALRDEFEIIDFKKIREDYTAIYNGIQSGSIISAHTVKTGGIAEAVSKMCWGNLVGMQFTANIDKSELFAYNPGSIVLEIKAETDLSKLFPQTKYTVLGKTIAEPVIKIDTTELQISRLQEAWESPLEKVFPTQAEQSTTVTERSLYTNRSTNRPLTKAAVPRVLIPVFPGTNCEYDTARAFEKAGAEVDIFTVKNLTPSDVDNSVKEMAAKIKQAQIIMIPGGFSAGDEPDGSGKFIAAFFRNPHIKDVVNELVGKRDGLMLGICNGFQALIKLGLVPFGEIRDMDENSPNLTFNTIGRHISHVAYTKVCSVKSPWLSYLNPGDIHAVAVSHGEGRFVAPQKIIDTMYSNGQVATQYVDSDGKLTNDSNLNGSFSAIEGITSPDGRILGKMGHSERIGNFVARNIYGNKDQKLFEAGVNYFR